MFSHFSETSCTYSCGLKVCLFIDMDDINGTNTSSYFRYYQDMLNTPHQCNLYDAIAPLATTTASVSYVDDFVKSENSDSLSVEIEEASGGASFDKQLKLAQLIVYSAQEFVINKGTGEFRADDSSSFFTDIVFSFMQIIFFISFICLIKQYLNLRVVKEEPLRLINKTGEYDAYDLVPDTPLNRKASQKQADKQCDIMNEKSREKQQINSKINRQNNYHLINNDLFTERETILLLNKLNAASNNNSNSNAPISYAGRKKYNTDKFVTNKRKCTSVGPVMNTSFNKEMLAIALEKDEKFASMLDKNVQQQHQEHDENSLTCACEANWRQAVLMHHQNEAAIYNNMCV